MKVSEHVKRVIAAHADNEAPKECCGLLIRYNRGYKYLPGINHSDTPLEEFQLNVQECLGEFPEEKIVAVVHSHVSNNTDFSQVDKASANMCGYEWVLFNQKHRTWRFYFPGTYKVPILEREWFYGITDCYTLLYDVYQEMGIELPQWKRPPLEELLGSSESIYADALPKHGFHQLDSNEPLEKYDVVLMALGNNPHVGTHVGIIMNPETRAMVHHLVNRLSESTVYGEGGFWHSKTVGVYRYGKVKES